MLNNTKFLLILLLSLPFHAVMADKPSTITTVQPLQSFDALFKQSKKEHKVIMLEMSASYCGFCRKLEAEIINPMIISGDYNHVLIRQLHIDSYHDIKMPNNKTTTPAEYAKSKGIFVTPTLLFLNDKNEEISKRILGINSVDYFGAYVDEALKEGAEKLD